MCEHLIDLIIPTYKPGAEFSETLRGLASQTILPDRLFVVNTEEEFWDPGLERDYPGLIVSHISKSEFNHGTTRFEAAKESDARILMFMTQDAVPADTRLIEKLIGPIERGEAAASYARQIAGAGADPIEKITRKYNYPPVSRIKSRDDLEELGVKTFFCSNVCAAYDREIYEKLGGFPHPLEFNEDMIYASKLIEAGYRISYTADAKVFHSHNYSAKEQYERNFLVGRTQAMYPEIFEKYPSEKEGIGLVKDTASGLIRCGKPMYVFKLAVLSGAKYLGYRAGKRSVKRSI